MIGSLESWVPLMFRSLNNTPLILPPGPVAALPNRKPETLGSSGLRLINVGSGIV